MSRKKFARARRGFSLLTVIIVVAMVAVSSVVVLEIVTQDQQSVRFTRERIHAREVAEGALMEVANDTDTVNQLPGIDNDEIAVKYAPSSGSAYLNEKGDAHRPSESYEATISHVRFVPVLESSITRVTAVVYQVETTATVNDGAGSQQIEAEVYRVVGLPVGKVLPRVHAR